MPEWDNFKQTVKIAKEKYGLEIPGKETKPIPSVDILIPNLPTILNKDDYYKEDKNGVPRFKAPLLAEDICFNDNHNRGIRVTSDNKKIYWFNGKYWRDNGEEVIKNIIQQILGESTCQKHKNEVIGWIKDCLDLQIDRETLDSDKYKIGVKNGVFDLQTQTLLPFDKKYFITALFPFNHNRLAKCDRFKQFLGEILEENDIKVIQEMFGYCFLKDYPLAVMFFLVGIGRNGKSTLLNVLIKMLGKENVSNVPIQSLCDDNFSGIDLYHKCANIVSDLSTKELDHTGKLKQLTGNDYIRARDLYEKSMKFKSCAKLINAMNEIPVCHDKTLAWMQRCACVEFPNQFLDGVEGTDKYLIDKLTTEEEIEGAFIWAMEGFQRIQEKGTFSTHKNLDDMVNFIAQTKNAILQFVKEHIRSKPGNEVLKSKVYENFLHYCKNHKPEFTTVASNHFTTKFKQYMMENDISFGEGDSKILDGRTWKNIEYYDNENAEETQTNDFNSLPNLDDYTELEIAAGIDKIEGRNPTEVQREADDE